MTRANELTLLTDGLAAHWTEPVLEIVAAVARLHVSIDLEVQAWHIVEEVLQLELQSQQHATLVSLPGLMERVLRRAAEQLMLRIMPHSVTPAVRTHILQLACDRRSTAAERELFTRIIREPSLGLAFKSPSGSDFTPRLRVLPVLAEFRAHPRPYNV